MRKDWGSPRIHNFRIFTLIFSKWLEIWSKVEIDYITHWCRLRMRYFFNSEILLLIIRSGCPLMVWVSLTHRPKILKFRHSVIESLNWLSLIILTSITSLTFISAHVIHIASLSLVNHQKSRLKSHDLSSKLS